MKTGSMSIVTAPSGSKYERQQEQMPRLNESMASNQDLSGYAPIEAPVMNTLVKKNGPTPAPASFLRSSIAPIGTVNSQGLAQWDMGGRYPQIQFFARNISR